MIFGTPLKEMIILSLGRMSVVSTGRHISRVHKEPFLNVKAAVS